MMTAMAHRTYMLVIRASRRHYRSPTVHSSRVRF